MSTARIRKSARRFPPRIGLTSSAVKRYEGEVMPMSAILQKPWNDDELLGTIRLLLGDRAPLPQSP